MYNTHNFVIELRIPLHHKIHNFVTETYIVGYTKRIFRIEIYIVRYITHNFVIDLYIVKYTIHTLSLRMPSG